MPESSNSRSVASGISPLEITRQGHPALAQVAQAVGDPTHPSTFHVANQMLATLQNHHNGVGLAAPQVGISLRIILFQLPQEGSADIDNVNNPYTVAINPSFEPLDETIESDWEGCLSLPGMMGKVPRYKHIYYTYQTLENEMITRKASDFHARVIQHEIDHLNGISYIERMQDLKSLGFIEEITQYQL